MKTIVSLVLIGLLFSCLNLGNHDIIDNNIKKIEIYKITCQRNLTTCVKMEEIHILTIQDSDEINDIITKVNDAKRFIVKFIPDYKIELISQDNKMTSILINENFINVDGLTYKTNFNLGKYIVKKGVNN
jgi:hypothetical protein